MQQIIDTAVQEIIQIIDSKKNSTNVAWQFILEELDVAQHGTEFVVDRIQRFYINKSDYNGALKNSWEDVDGSTGPQQYLLGVTSFVAEKTDFEIAAMVRITIVEYVLKHYKFGRYFLNTESKRANKPLALFDIIAKPEKLNPNFKHILPEEYEPVRNVLNRWASGFEDRDNKFNHQFQETFNS
ncbi:hypothetical protein [Photobacterium phosphoreum]|nr:hypothetical protein [Photobacterium phosphoreum]MCD9481080.1 hypothetical protein [Photobacterium phosphoreum]